MDQRNGRYDATAHDVSHEFKISLPATYRLAREKRLPPDAYTYLNGRTLRFDLNAVREWARQGGARAA